jgi:predicted DNA binding CopG/RHH family protein
MNKLKPKTPKPMTQKQIDAEAAYADKIYRNRAAVEREALGALQAAASGSRQVTIRLSNSEIALARKQAEAKGLKYQTYMKMLLHEALAAGARRRLA